MHDDLTAHDDLAAWLAVAVADVTSPSGIGERALARVARRRRRRGLVGAVAVTALVVGLGALLQGRTPTAGDRLTIDPTSRPTASSTTVSSPARNVVALSVSADFRVQAAFRASTVVVGKHLGPYLPGTTRAAVAVFPPAPDASCIRAASLTWLVVEPPSGDLALRVYPSAALSLADGRVPEESSGTALTLLDNRPTDEQVVSGGSGSVSFDVTDLVRLWSQGGPFPSQGRQIAPHLPVVLQVRVRAYDDGDDEVTFAGLGSGPVLTYTLMPSCPASTAPPDPRSVGRTGTLPDAQWQLLQTVDEPVPTGTTAGVQSRTLLTG